jgi:hypothetical protein
MILQNADPDKAFIKQVFYGCITCKKALKVKNIRC